LLRGGLDFSLFWVAPPPLLRQGHHVHLSVFRRRRARPTDRQTGSLSRSEFGSKILWNETRSKEKFTENIKKGRNGGAY
jgi:hypothetical protein